MNFEKKEIACPVSLLGRTAHKFSDKITNIKSEFYMIKDGREVNGKSLLGLLSAQIRVGDIVTICCNNEDKELALFELTHIITILNGLGVDETM